MARKAGEGVKFTVQGAKEIQRAFKVLPRAVANKVIRQSIRTALKPVLAAAKREAPVSSPTAKSSKSGGRDAQGRFLAATPKADGDHAPGLLRKSIKLRARLKRKRGVIALDVRVGDGDFKSETFYAAMVNFGTEFQEGQRYMEEAFDGTKDAASKTVVKLIHAGVNREWSNL